MLSETRKLHLIEAVLKINSEDTLYALEDLLKKNKKRSKVKNDAGFKDFAGIWSENEAAEIERAITESCEQINPDDWK